MSISAVSLKNLFKILVISQLSVVSCQLSLPDHFRDFQEINYPNKRTTEAQRTQRENFCVSFGTFFYLEVPLVPNLMLTVILD
jgi:hypothetical protein